MKRGYLYKTICRELGFNFWKKQKQICHGKRLDFGNPIYNKYGTKQKKPLKNSLIRFEPKTPAAKATTLTNPPLPQDDLVPKYLYIY